MSLSGRHECLAETWKQAIVSLLKQLQQLANTLVFDQSALHTYTQSLQRCQRGGTCCVVLYLNSSAEAV